MTLCSRGKTSNIFRSSRAVTWFSFNMQIQIAAVSLLMKAGAESTPVPAKLKGYL